MTYRVVLIESEEGFAVFCPVLPGCASQGTTEAEALDAIREAIGEVLDCGGTPAADDGRAAEVEMLREASADGLAVSVRAVELAVAA